MRLMPSPLVTLREADALLAARDSGAGSLNCSLDLQRSQTTIDIGSADWGFFGERYTYPRHCKARTIYYWNGAEFLPLSRYSYSLIKLIPTEWGAPTFEIDGIKMLPSARSSPYGDAQRKVRLIEPRGKVILDTCGGLGYFAAWCLQFGAAHVHSFEKSSDVIWLRSFNPWSPRDHSALTLVHGDVQASVAALTSGSMDAVLHDPPRFGIAGELYSQRFYGELGRVLKPRGRLFHYTGAPNLLSAGRRLALEVAQRLRLAGFSTQPVEDGLIASKRGKIVGRRRPTR